jgi:hypothetical protein
VKSKNQQKRRQAGGKHKPGTWLGPSTPRGKKKRKSKAPNWAGPVSQSLASRRMSHMRLRHFQSLLAQPQRAPSPLPGNNYQSILIIATVVVVVGAAADSIPPSP